MAKARVGFTPRWPLRVLLVVMIIVTPLSAIDDRYLRASLDIARWLRSQARRDGSAAGPGGTAWPAHADEPDTVSSDLYHGGAGVVLFYIDAYRITGRLSFRHQAETGADHLLETLPMAPSPETIGLYTGISGVGFALQETFKITGDERYRRGARECLAKVLRRAVPAGGGTAWNDSTDVISGTAGIGLFLIYAARELTNPAALEYARGGARRLIELGQPDMGGLKWPMTETFPRQMPNFSHGTAGVAYFLATLYRETHEKRLLDAALDAAKYLLSIAHTDGETCLVFHHDPGGRDLYYLGWCHGPPGTGRLFYRLWEVTGDARWLEWLEKLARGVIASGIPAQKTAGFWNNLGQCCGSAGVAEFFLHLSIVTQKREYLEFARRLADDTIVRGQRDAQGLRFVHAEHRLRPEHKTAQTGYMQGAAGIGMLFLHLENYHRRKASGLQLPDSPFMGR